jgi:hypothetical protein
MDLPPIDWLRQAAHGKLDATGVNVWKALRHRAYIQVIGLDDNVMETVTRLDRVKGFRVTRRGHQYLNELGAVRLPFNKNDPPRNIVLWLSTLRRLSRNFPAGLVLACSDKELRVLAKDIAGKVQDDAAHHIASVKVPWHMSS